LCVSRVLKTFFCLEIFFTVCSQVCSCWCENKKKWHCIIFKLIRLKIEFHQCNVNLQTTSSFWESILMVFYQYRDTWQSVLCRLCSVLICFGVINLWCLKLKSPLGLELCDSPWNFLLIGWRGSGIYIPLMDVIYEWTLGKIFIASFFVWF